jgi:hypothetical protein
VSASPSSASSGRLSTPPSPSRGPRQACCSSPTSQPTTIDRGRLPPRWFSPAPCATEHFAADSFLRPPSRAAFASPSSSVAPWCSPAASTTFPASSLACRRLFLAADPPRRGRPSMVSLLLPFAPKRVHRTTEPL